MSQTTPARFEPDQREYDGPVLLERIKGLESQLQAAEQMIMELKADIEALRKEAALPKTW